MATFLDTITERLRRNAAGQFSTEYSPNSQAVEGGWLTAGNAMPNIDEYLTNLSWQDLLQQGFDKAPSENYGNVMYGQDGGQRGYDLFGTLVNRMNATGWDDATKKSAVQRAIENHYGQTGSGFTEWSGPEGIAALLGLPTDASRQANESQQFSQAHETYSAQADAESMANAIKILGGLGAAYLGPGGGLADLFGGAAPVGLDPTSAAGAMGGAAGSAGGGLSIADAAGGLPGLDGLSGGFDMGGLPDYTSPNVFDPGGGTFDASGLPNYTSPTLPTMPTIPPVPPVPPGGNSGTDPYGNHDMGNGPTGTETIANPPTTTPSTGNPLQDLWRNFTQNGNLPTLGVTNFLQNLFGSNGQQGGYQFPIGDVVNSILGYTSSNNASQQMDALMRYAIERSDPFASQRAQYQTRLNELYSNPDSYLSTGAAGQVADAAARRAAAYGHNLGTNQVTGVARSLYDTLGQEKDRVANLAGAQFSPAGAGSIVSSMGPQVVNQQQQAMGNLGFGANSVANGQQPSFMSQMFGAPTNQNFWQSLMGSVG